MSFLDGLRQRELQEMYRRYANGLEPLPVGQSRTVRFDEEPKHRHIQLHYPRLEWLAAGEMLNGVLFAGWIMAQFTEWLRVAGMPGVMSIALGLLLSFVAIATGCIFAWSILEMRQ